MSNLSSRSKFLISISSVFTCLAVTYLIVGLSKGLLPEGGVRNSTDEIGNHVLLSRADFLNDNLDSDWESTNNPLFVNQAAVFAEEDQRILSPQLHNSYTKYVEIDIDNIDGELDAVFLLSGYDKDNILLEETHLSISQTGVNAYRFAYDHVFIQRIAFTFIGQESSLVVDNIAIYALQ